MVNRGWLAISMCVAGCGGRGASHEPPPAVTHDASVESASPTFPLGKRTPRNGRAIAGADGAWLELQVDGQFVRFMPAPAVPAQAACVGAEPAVGSLWHFTGEREYLLALERTATWYMVDSGSGCVRSWSALESGAGGADGPVVLEVGAQCDDPDDTKATVPGGALRLTRDRLSVVDDGGRVIITLSISDAAGQVGSVEAPVPDQDGCYRVSASIDGNRTLTIDAEHKTTGESGAAFDVTHTDRFEGRADLDLSGRSHRWQARRVVHREQRLGLCDNTTDRQQVELLAELAPGVRISASTSATIEQVEPGLEPWSGEANGRDTACGWEDVEDARCRRAESRTDTEWTWSWIRADGTEVALAEDSHHEESRGELPAGCADASIRPRR